jgi:hypothetical protein
MIRGVLNQSGCVYTCRVIGRDLFRGVSLALGQHVVVVVLILWELPVGEVGYPLETVARVREVAVR